MENQGNENIRLYINNFSAILFIINPIWIS